MPFQPISPHRFSAASVRTYAPSAPGVYGLSNASEWIYIGAADDIQTALLSYFDRPERQIMRFAPSGFVFEVCWPQDHDDRVRRLVTEYSPVCNRSPAPAEHRNSGGR